ncbi:MAG: ROK family protein [Pirellulales bacterium]
MPGPAAQPPLFVGIDVGGTNIKIGLVDDAGQTVAHASISTEEKLGAEDGCRRIAQSVRQLVTEAPVRASDVARAGLVTPGPIDVPRGLILQPGNIPNWWDFPIRERASHHLGIPVTFNNDANAAAYGEFWRGAGAQFQSMILLTLGTGVGGGIIIGDMLIDGIHNCGGECGHILVDPRDDAPRDSLGKSGSLESYCNASALVARVRAALDAGEASTLAPNLRTPEKISPRLIAEAAESGDALARRAVMETAHWLAIGIVSLVHTIDPDAVVLGGAMNFGGPTSRLGREFLEQIREEVRPRLLQPLRDAVKIEFAALGGAAGYIGAARQARLDFKKGTGPVTTLT